MLHCDYCHKEMDRKVFCSDSHRSLYHKKVKGDESSLIKPQINESSPKPSVDELKNLISEESVNTNNFGRCNGCGQKADLEDIELVIDYEKVTKRICSTCSKKARRENANSLGL